MIRRVHERLAALLLGIAMAVLYAVAYAILAVAVVVWGAVFLWRKVRR